MKKIKFFFLFLALPFVMAAQDYNPSDFYGVIYVGQKKKTIEYSYLNNPVCGTAIPYFDHLPTTGEYNANGKHLLHFAQVQSIEFMKFNDEEKNMLDTNCPGCFLRKARITLQESNPAIPSIVFLALKQVDWKSSSMPGYEELRTMEARFLNKITINVRKK